MAPQHPSQTTASTQLATSAHSDLEAKLVHLTQQRNALVRALLAGTDHNTADTDGTFSRDRQQPGEQHGAVISSEDSPTEAQVAAALTAAKRARADHIKLLMRYNDVKDVAQGLMGVIAEERGCRVVEVMEEFGVGADD